MNQSEHWSYDNVGNVQTVTDRKSQATQYQYDALDRLSLVTYADSSTVTPTYDAGNRLTSLVDTVSGNKSCRFPLACLLINFGIVLRI